MSVECFKEEFTKLLHRFVTPIKDTNFSVIVTPLTHQDILESVTDVLSSKLDITLVNPISDDVKTPATGIIVTTPDAPDIPKVNLAVLNTGSIPGRFRSLDTLTFESLKDTAVDQLLLPEPGQLESKIVDNVDSGNTDIQVERIDEKMISKSSPSLDKLARSDTFVRENEDASESKIKTSKEEKFDFVATIGAGNDEVSIDDLHTTPEILKKVKGLKDSVNQMMNQIIDIEKLIPGNNRSIHRLSAIGTFPGFASGITKTTQRSKMTRRSISAFPGTPTSSRLSLVDATNDSERRKSTSAMSLANTNGTQLSIPSTYRSVSSGSLLIKKSPLSYSSPKNRSLTSCVKKQKTPPASSPMLSLLSDKSEGRKIKNPKYAHIQSTIPKHGIALGKRKAN